MKTLFDFIFATEIVVALFTLGMLVIRKWDGRA